MKLMTKEIAEKFEKFPLYTQEEKGLDAEVVVKYFNPVGAGTWLITEGQYEEEVDDWLFFGYCHIFEWEWGYVRLSDFENIKLPFDMGIERDLYLKDGATVRDCLD